MTSSEGSSRKPFSIHTIDFLSVMDHMDEGVLITDDQGVIHYYNETQAQIDGLEPEFVIGKKVTEIYELSGDTSLIMLCLQTGKPIHNSTFFYKTIYGKIANTIHSTLPIFDGGRVSGVICFVKDYKILRETTPMVSIPELKPRKKNGTRYTFADIIGSNKQLVNAVNTARTAADSTSPIMLIGETGTGKELFAQSIHNQSSRGNKPYIAINCAAIPESLLEGLLFGTAKGAFTGAEDKPGLLEQANNGTLFLDELLSMPIGLQVKLLRVLQEKKVQRVGSLDEVSLNLKVISSINRAPRDAIARNELRTDLFYRIGVVLVKIPPLRDRIDDLPELLNHFLRTLNSTFGTHVKTVTDDVLSLFQSYDWPGNIRELEHLLEGAVNVVGFNDELSMKYFVSAFDEFGGSEQSSSLAADNGVNSAMDNRSEGRVSNQSNKGGSGLQHQDFVKSQTERERKAITEVLSQTFGNVSRSAELLGISRQLLHYKMKKHKLSRTHFIQNSP